MLLFIYYLFTQFTKIKKKIVYLEKKYNQQNNNNTKQKTNQPTNINIPPKNASYRFTMENVYIMWTG